MKKISNISILFSFSAMPVLGREFEDALKKAELTHACMLIEYSIYDLGAAA
jgi:hypothetical protein